MSISKQPIIFLMMWMFDQSFSDLCEQPLSYLSEFARFSDDIQHRIWKNSFEFLKHAYILIACFITRITYPSSFPNCYFAVFYVGCIFFYEKICRYELYCETYVRRWFFHRSVKEIYFFYTYDLMFYVLDFYFKLK